MPTNEDYLASAIHLATTFHKGLTDSNGKPAIFHPLTVMMDNELDTYPKWCCAAMHDTLEDTKMPKSFLRDFPREVEAAVIAITHLPNEPNDKYYARVKADAIATAVKRCDIRHNTSPKRFGDLLKAKPDDKERLLKKYIKACTEFGLGTIAEGRLWAMLDDMRGERDAVPEPERVQENRPAS